MPHPQIEAVIFDVAGTLLPCDAHRTTSTSLLPEAAELLSHLSANQQRIGLLTQQPLQLPSALDHYPCLSTEQTRRGAPAPDLPVLAAIALESHALRQCVLVSGSAAGITAGLNAGMWTVGTALSGSLEHATMADWQAMPAAERDQLRMQATITLLNAGAHYVIDAVDELAHCLTDIAQRLHKGERA
ncbi:haloacid dehalogenase superfamily, subfamily IA, variant 3 with third motif having DD or ED [Halopseudomonas sabulinigri]|uniref:Haloacid dehalogenase superfamily, subfamily IA, variant 3 with third motif having DD or ED n=1 Tax=Halopseudomonas sabulinigri TaxID=472181 RepID=A0A1H1NK35_9GAMM|nr:hypothetical protein [Halopseudomonas sabulinigri]SDR99364.1 haloacid dehalogenase superfamily, subfamily IA, variant 3 with third motif having DD or ED [Halopseudomonas sabulinigri]